LALAVGPAEAIISWNHARGVYNLRSVGQLIPFIIGLGQYVAVLYLAAKSRLGRASSEDSNQDGDSADGKRLAFTTDQRRLACSHL